MLPNAYLIGFPKCASSSLYMTLGQHPDIFVPGQDELGFFLSNLEFAQGFPYYEETYFRGVLNHTVALDCNPAYILDSKALRRIKQACADPVVLIVVRNPVHRAISHYWHRLSLMTERRGIDAALLDSLTTPVHNPLHNHAYAAVSKYSDFVAEALSLFNPSRVHVLTLDDIAERPRETLAAITRCLGVADTLQEFAEENLGRRHQLVERASIRVHGPDGVVAVDRPIIGWLAIEGQGDPSRNSFIVEPSTHYRDAYREVAAVFRPAPSAQTIAALADHLGDYFARAPEVFDFDPMALTR